MVSFSDVLILVLLFFCCSCDNGNSKNDKVVFVDNQKLLSEFIMSQEMTHQMESKVLDYQIYMDSLELILSSKSTSLDVTDSVSVIKFIEFKNFYEAQKNLVLEKSQTENQMCNEQIMNQLNSYIEEFGKSREYKIILGANGQGALLYADDKIDITNEVIEFVNAKYAGN